jgi:formamidopyrimidine-DNA glycosylase
MKKRKRPVKEVLLDQTLLAGVGNILAIETLWAAKLDPRTPARLMTAKDVHAIATSLRKLIERILDHREKTAKAGEYSMEPFRIYGHAGEPCPRDGVALRQIVQGGRGTTFCPGCQKRHVAPTRSRRA